MDLQTKTGVSVMYFNFQRRDWNTKRQQKKKFKYIDLKTVYGGYCIVS